MYVFFWCQKGLSHWPKGGGGWGEGGAETCKTKTPSPIYTDRRLQGAAVGELGSAAGLEAECVAFGFPLLAQPWPQPV